MPRGIKAKVEEVREATDDREDYYTTTIKEDGSRAYNPTKLGLIVVAVIALVLLGVLIF